MALARECNISIVDASINELNKLREYNNLHQIIAVACSINHAHQIVSLYKERNLKVELIHSNMKQNDIENTINKLRKFQIDCIVQVKMLGEGFDHPFLSVAAIFQPFRSLSPYVQFIGRIMRVVEQNSPDNPNNQGVIISHVGLNIDKYWDDFKNMDVEDQNLIKKWIVSDIDYIKESKLSREFKEEKMIVKEEVVSHYEKEKYLMLTNEAIIDDLSAYMDKLGIDLNELGLTKDDLLSKLLSSTENNKIDPYSIPVSPQNKRLSSKSELNKIAKSHAANIINNIDVDIKGTEVSSLFPEEDSKNNYSLVIKLLNRKINDFLHIESNMRNTVSFEKLNTVIQNIDKLSLDTEKDITNRMNRN